jgi:hypothetical protein
MKHSMMILLGGALASLIAIPQALAFFAQKKSADAGELRERDEIRQTFKLTPGTRVEVSSIRGSVEIETADTDVAEVHIVRSAQSRKDLEQFKVGIENKPQSLIIRGETRRRDSGAGDGPEVRQHVMLRLPRRVDLSIETITGEVRLPDVGGQLVVGNVGGSLNVGAVDGQIQIVGVGHGVSIGRAGQQVEIKNIGGDVKIGQAADSRDAAGSGNFQPGQRGLQINTVGGSLDIDAADGQVQIVGVGHGVSIGRAGQQVEIKTVTGDVKIGQAAGSLDVAGIGGTLSVGISKLGQRGLQINTVTGRVELRFRDELNAQLSTDSIIGELSIDLPNVTVQGRPSPAAIRAQIGKGGPPISIKSVSQGVRLVKGS